MRGVADPAADLGAEVAAAAEAEVADADPRRVRVAAVELAQHAQRRADEVVGAPAAPVAVGLSLEDRIPGEVGAALRGKADAALEPARRRACRSRPSRATRSAARGRRRGRCAREPRHASAIAIRIAMPGIRPRARCEVPLGGLGQVAAAVEAAGALPQAAVKPGHQTPLRPFSSRYQLAQPPSFQTLSARRRSVSRLNAS